MDITKEVYAKIIRGVTGAAYETGGILGENAGVVYGIMKLFQKVICVI